VLPCTPLVPAAFTTTVLIHLPTVIVTIAHALVVMANVQLIAQGSLRWVAVLFLKGVTKLAEQIRKLLDGPLPRLFTGVGKANRRARPINVGLQALRVSPVEWVPEHIGVGIYPPLQSDRIALYIPPDPRVEIPEVVVLGANSCVVDRSAPRRWPADASA